MKRGDSRISSDRLESLLTARLLSFDETVISLFLSGPRASTLPVEMVRYVESRTDPMVDIGNFKWFVGEFLAALNDDAAYGLDEKGRLKATIMKHLGRKPAERRKP